MNANKDIKEILQFSIYNRWGEKVFEVKNFAPNDNDYTGVFAYIVEAQTQSNDLISKYGSIMVIK